MQQTVLFIQLLLLFILVHAYQHQIVWQKTSKNGFYRIVGFNLRHKLVIASAREAGLLSEHYVEVIPFDSQQGKPVLELNRPNMYIATSRYGDTLVTYTPRNSHNRALNTTLEKWNLPLRRNPVPAWKVTLVDDRVIPSLSPPSILQVNDDGSVIAIPDRGETVLSLFSKQIPFYKWSNKKQLIPHLLKNDETNIIVKQNYEVILLNWKQNRAIWSRQLERHDDFSCSPSGKYAVYLRADNSLEFLKWERSRFIPLLIIPSEQNIYFHNAVVTDSGYLIIGVCKNIYCLNTELRVYRMESPKPLWVHQLGMNRVYTDRVEAIKVTDDERYFIIGTSGNQTREYPQAKVFSFDSNRPIWTLNTQGSVLAVDIAKIDNQLHVVVGSKYGHSMVHEKGGNLYYARITLPEENRLH